MEYLDVLLRLPRLEELLSTELFVSGEE